MPENTVDTETVIDGLILVNLIRDNNQEIGYLKYTKLDNDGNPQESIEESLSETPEENETRLATWAQKFHPDTEIIYHLEGEDGQDSYKELTLRMVLSKEGGEYL